MTSGTTLPRIAHQLDGIECWCHPDIFVACSCASGCSLCDGEGRIRVSRALAPATLGTLLIVHHGAASLIVQ